VIRVLHVDDDPGFAEMVATYLEREDERMEVLTASGFEDGLEIFADRRVDCVVSDYDMPGRDGIQFLEAVREDAPDLPFILFTGKGSEDIAAEAIEQGVSSYLQKEGGTAQYTVLCNRIEAHVERYRTQQEVARLKQEYQLVSETATDSFWVSYPETDRLRIDGVEKFGYDDYEATIDWWLERLHPEDRNRVVERDEAMLADEANAFDRREPGRGWFTNEYRLERADGTYAPCLERGVVVFDDGDPVKMVGTTTDVTERKERERELERQNERLDEFASTVSHDLRNPLNVAEGRIELARAERESEHLDAAAAAVDRSFALIEDLLVLAREGEWVSEVSPVSLPDTVEESWRSVQTGDATLAVETDRTIQADPRRLQRLLENLVRNSIEHGSTSPPASREDAVEHGGDDVTVTVGDTEDGFYVADDGPGIPEDEREQVFETGYSTAREGTGFGLTIVAGIAEAHGWEVGVAESSAGGARFEITGVEIVGD